MTNKINEREIILKAVGTLFQGVYSSSKSYPKFGWKVRIHSPTGPIVWAKLSGGVVTLTWNHSNRWESEKVPVRLGTSKALKKITEKYFGNENILG